MQFICLCLCERFGILLFLSVFTYFFLVSSKFCLKRPAKQYPDAATKEIIQENHGPRYLVPENSPDFKFINTKLNELHEILQKEE